MISLIIHNSQDRIKIPSSFSSSSVYIWRDITFNYPDYFLNFMIESPLGNVIIQNPNVKIIKKSLVFELIELHYTIHINKGLKITCMLGAVYLGRGYVKGGMKYIWKCSEDLSFGGFFSPRGELSLVNLQNDANDLKLIQSAVSSGFDLSKVYTDLVNEYEEEEERICFNLPCILREEERYVKLKIYNFKFTPPKCAEVLFKNNTKKQKKRLQGKAFDGKLKAYLKIQNEIKIVKVVIQVSDEDVLEFNKVQKLITLYFISLAIFNPISCDGKM
jgi:hypothetical protein